MENKKEPQEELFIGFKSYEQLHYLADPVDIESVRVYRDNQYMGNAQLWNDNEMFGRPYIIINCTVEYLDTMRTLMPMDMLISTICEEYHVTRDELKSPAKKRRISDPRCILFYMLRTKYKLGLQEIADTFNRLSHATVMSGVRTVAGYMEVDVKYRAMIEALCIMRHTPSEFQELTTD